MKKIKRFKKIVISVSAILAGGTVLDNGCFNTLASINVCGTLLTPNVCSPVDQLNLLMPFLEVPDFRADPSCTIPLGCDGPFGDDLNLGGSAPEDPQDDTGGGGVGGGGAGG